MRRRTIISAVGALCVFILGVTLATAQGPAPQDTGATQAALGTAFTYQGRLTDSNGDPVTGTCNFNTTLYADSGGTAQVATDAPPSTTVTDGRFTIGLDFGAGAFDGNARWLEIVADCGAGAKTFPLQRVTPAPYALYATDGPFWRLGGNAGTAPVTDFLGTTDNTALELRVNDARALRIEPGDGPNVIAGSAANKVTDGAVGVFIGGGTSGEENTVSDDFGTVTGGANNWAGSDDGDATSDRWATVSGGQDNTAGAPRATVGGGHRNEATGLNSTVGGGHNNTASSSYSTVAGGNNNTAAGFYSAVCGGTNNSADARFATIGGGGWTDTSNRDTTSNVVHDNYGTIGGGGNNRAGSDDGSIASDEFATVGGGEANVAQSSHATVGGGDNNTASGPYATVAGGRTNVAGSEYHGTVGGGVGNEATGSEATVSGGDGNTAAGTAASVPGGFANEANGNYSLAAGYRAKAQHSGSFVWADAQKADFASTGDDQFLVRADGGAGIGTNSPQSQLHVVDTPPCCLDDLPAHVASIENEATSSWPNVLALKVNIDDPDVNTNFITFWDSNEAVGAIEGDGSGGVTLDTTSSDFAEYLPKREVHEILTSGDVVGMHAGTLGKETVGAAKVMVVTTSPAVLGNSPVDKNNDLFAPVAFVGQVPVKVRGSVTAGDYIVPSGRNDGTGMAVSPGEITTAQAGHLVGRALESADGAGVSKVNTLVGLPHEQVLQTVLEQRDARIAELEAQIDRLDRQNAELAERIDSVERRVDKQTAPAPIAGLPLPPWFLGVVLLGAIVVWRRHDGRSLV